MSYYYPQAAMTINVLFEDFRAFSDPTLQKTYGLNIQCKNLSINVNDYKTTDTFDCEVEYKSFPFDPRTIRSAQVTIHIEDMESVYDSSGNINKLVPSDDNAIFTGFVDEESIEFDDSKRTVRFQGRDLTSLLIDQKYVQNAPIQLTDPLDAILTNMLAAFPATKNLKVSNITGKSLPTLAQYAPDAVSAPLAGGKNVGAHETYWDIIQDLVARAGLIAYMHLDTLYISNPRTIFNSNKAVKFIFGKNIKSLSYQRKLGRHKGFNVTVRSLNAKAKTVITANIPEQAETSWCTALNLPAGQPITIPKLNPDGSLSSASDKAPYLAFRIPNITTQPALIQVGQKIFEELIRQDLEGSFETFEMVGHSGDADTDRANYQAYDLTTGATVVGAIPFDIGQPVSIEIQTDDLDAISRIASAPARVQYLMTRGYASSVASVFAKTIGKMAPIFYTKSIQISFNQDTGFKLKVGFINYIDLSNKGL